MGSRSTQTTGTRCPGRMRLKFSNPATPSVPSGSNSRSGMEMQNGRIKLIFAGRWKSFSWWLPPLLSLADWTRRKRKKWTLSLTRWFSGSFRRTISWIRSSTYPWCWTLEMGTMTSLSMQCIRIGPTPPPRSWMKSLRFSGWRASRDTPRNSWWVPSMREIRPTPTVSLNLPRWNWRTCPALCPA